MCRLLGMMCNDADLSECAIREVRDALVLGEEHGHHGIGVGYYSNDDPLLKRRPSDTNEPIDFAQLVEGIESNALLIHIRRATVGAWKTSNTHPFRFRRWLFAHVGHLPALEPEREKLMAQLPPFLARAIQGETDSELFFHVLLDKMFTDGTLNDLGLPAEKLATYLHECARELAELHAGSADKPTYAVVVTNGQIMGAICRGVPMHYSHREGIHQCELHDKSDHERQSHARFKGIMLGAQMIDPGHQWREVADGTLLTISKGLELKVESL
jgi:glutamine amidotransferase